MSRVWTTPTWIIGKNADLIWFTGSAGGSFVLLTLFYLCMQLGLSIIVAAGVVYLIWAIIFDATHLFATYTRTYFDRQFRQEHALLTWCSLLILLVGPMLVWAHYFFLGQEEAQAFSITFHRFALIYAYYHLCRQHWGILALYNKKNGEDVPLVRRSEGLLLTFGLAYPFIHALYASWGLQKLSLAERLPVPGAEAWDAIFSSLVFVAIVVWLVALAIFSSRTMRGRLGDDIVYFLLKAGFIPLAAATIVEIIRYFGIDNTLATLNNLLLAGFIIVLIWNLFLYYRKARGAAGLNPAKLIFLATVLGTNNFILHLELPLVMYVVALTMFHDLQYHRIVRFHNVNKYQAADGLVRYGFASILTRKLAVLVGMSLIFAVLFVLPRASNEAFNAMEMLNYTISTLFWGIAFHHYVMDSRIWKMRNINNLEENLQVKST